MAWSLISFSPLLILFYGKIVGRTKTKRLLVENQQKDLKKKRVVVYLTDEEYVKLFEKSREVGLNPTSFIVSRLIYGVRW